jgi:tubulin beta
LWKVVYNEHGIGGSGEYFSDNDAHLDRISLFNHEALGCKYVPRAMPLDLKPGVIGAVTLSRRSTNSSARATSWPIRAGKHWAKGHYKRVQHQCF